MKFFAPPASLRGRFALVATLLPLVALVPATIRAYVLTGASWPANSSVTFQMALGNAGRTLIDGNTSWDVAAMPAGGAWDQSIQRLNLVMSPNPSAPISQGDGINSIAFASSFFGSSFGSNTLAITGWSTRSGVTTEADILFNNKISWDSYRGALRFGNNGYAIGEIRRVLTHELGHAIGLNHPDSAGQHVVAIMNSVMSAVEVPATDDINGAQALYGAPSASPPPTPTPSPTPTPPPTPTPTPTATPAVPIVSVSAAPTSVQSGGTATFTVTTSLVNPNATTTVSFKMTGSAKQGRQYALSSSQFTIPAGASSASVSLTVVKGTKQAKTAVLVLSASSGYTAASPSSASVTISK